jgi:ceramide glucosyltransferase
MVPEILGGLTIVSAGINLWQWLAACRFHFDVPKGHPRITRRFNAGSADQNTTSPEGTAELSGVTLLKPLKGADDYTSNCLESWLAQDYTGETQILFGVADPNDPACAVVRNLLKLYPHRDAELVICQPLLGANAKVSTLTHLQKKSKNDILIVSDADVVGPEHLLTEIAGNFQDEKTGLVNSFYKLRPPETLGMLWESIAINADFWSQVCQSNTIKPMSFALGAVMAIRREALEKIGGFSTLLNQLADDYQLGRRIHDAGYQIQLTNSVVECREEAKSFAETGKHQLRWARTIRVCQPLPYFFSTLSNTTLFALSAFAAGADWRYLAPVFLIRILTALHNSYRLTAHKSAILQGILAPLKDLLQFAIWLCAFTGNTVTWRGEKFYVTRGGALQNIDSVGNDAGNL